MLLVECDCIVAIVVAAYHLEDWNESVGVYLEDFGDGAGPFYYGRYHVDLPYSAFQERFRKTLVRGANKLAHRFWGWSSRLKLDDILSVV